MVVAGNSEYFIEYPENIHLFGLSFSTTLPTGTAWSGEVSYRPNAPVQLNTTDILFAGLTPLNPDVSVLSGGPGQDLHGYRRKEITQFQTTFTHFFDQVMGASRLTLVGEIGVVHTGGLESTSKARYGRDPVFGPGPLPNNQCVTLNAGTLGSPTAENVAKYCEDDGFVTSTAFTRKGPAARVERFFTSARRVTGFPGPGVPWATKRLPAARSGPLGPAGPPPPPEG